MTNYDKVVDRMSYLSYIVISLGENMQKIEYTKHSQKRCQQRGIPSEVIEFIIKNGDYFRTHEHKKFYMPKKKINLLKHKNKSFFIKFDKHLINTAVVCNTAADTVITAMKVSGAVKWN
jgi:hypothetical protein